MLVEVLSGRRVQSGSGSTIFGEEEIVTALLEKRTITDSASIEQDTEAIVAYLFDAAEEKSAEERFTEQLEEDLADERVTNEALSAQVERLADFILRMVGVEPEENEGAADTAIRVITTLQKQVMVKDAVNQVLKNELDARTAAVMRLEGYMQQILSSSQIDPHSDGLFSAVEKQGDPPSKWAIIPRQEEPSRIAA